jgi:hypothetical protein
MKSKILILRTLNNFLDDLSSSIISDKSVIPDFIDWDSCLSLEEFSADNNVQFQSDDFCIAGDEDIIKKLRKNRVDLEELRYIGWFSPDVHGKKWNQIKLMKPTDFNEIDSYKKLTRKPFIYFKENIRDNYLTNTLRGGLGLGLQFKQNEYFKFINNVSWTDNKWIINKEDIKPEDFEIIHQLMLFQNLKGTEIFNELISTIDDDKQENHFKLYNEILLFSLEYFAEENFESRAYIKLLSKHVKIYSSKLNDQSLLTKCDDFLFELQNLLNFITEEMPYEPQKEKRLIKIIKDFIVLSRVETNKLKKDIIDDRDYLLSTFFILGMYQKYDRIKKVIKSNKLEHFVISECAYRVSDFKFDENAIRIVFDESDRKDLWSTKFKFIYDEFEMIKEIKSFDSQSKKLKQEYLEIKDDITQLEDRKNIVMTKFKQEKIKIHRDIIEEEELIEKLMDKKNSLIVSRSKAERDEYLYWSSLSRLNDKSAFEKQIRNIKGEEFQTLCNDFEADIGLKLDRTADGQRYLTRASAGKTSNLDKIINYKFNADIKDEDLPKSQRDHLNQLKYEDLPKSQRDHLDQLKYEDLSKSQQNHLNQQFIDKDKKLTKKDVAEATMDSPQINMFNKNEYSIYRDSEKRMYAMKDGEKFIIDKILKDDEGVEYVIIDGNKCKCKLML